MTLAQPLAMKTRVKSPARVCGIGGMGMKCKKAFEPKTTKPRPSRTRAMMVRIFMSGLILYRGDVLITIGFGETPSGRDHRSRLQHGFRGRIVLGCAGHCSR